MLLSFSPLIRQYALVVTANLAVLTTGMSLGWSSPALVKLRNSSETPLSRPITEEEGSWIVSAGFLCAIITNLLGAVLLDAIGRKYCILLASIPKLCMALLLIFAKNVWIIILSRTIMNAMDGFLCTVVPIYASEIAGKDHRGALGTFMQLFSSLGILISFSVGPFMTYNGFSIVFTSVIAISTLPVLFLPDTPFYMYSKGRSEEAVKLLCLIRGSELLARQELKDYKLSSNKKDKIDKKLLIKNKTFLKALCLAILLSGGSQLIGFNAVSFYLQTILQSTNTSVMPEIASVIIGAIQVVASLCTLFMSNKFGRRTITLTSLVIMFFGMMGLGIFFQITKSEDNLVTGFMNYLPIISLILVIYSYNVGIGGLLMVIISELFDGPGRALGTAISAILSLVIIFLTTKYFAIVTLAIGPAVTYWFFSIMCVLVFVLIAIFIPETKGKTFNEIQIALGESTENHDTKVGNLEEPSEYSGKSNFM